MGGAQRVTKSNTFTKAEWSWIFYDWANSGYGIIVVTAVLPIFFKHIAALDGLAHTTATAYWAYADTFGTLIVSLLAPLLGALADYQHYKKRLFAWFTGLGIITTAGMTLIPQQAWLLLLGIYILTAIGYSGANIFYDSFLTDVTTNRRMDRVSSAGYGFGYAGGVVPFILFMVVQLSHGFHILSTRGIVNFAFLLAALWWLVFSLPMFKHVHQLHFLPPVERPIRTSLHRLKQTVSHIRQYRQIAIFLLAYFFYIDGVDTIYTMASPFGLDMGVKTDELIIVLLVVQLVAFPFTLIYGWLAKRWGTKRVLMVGVLIYLGICLYALMIHNVIGFWVLAVLVGTSQGGVQALSRSYFAQLVPKEQASEFFGFYNIFGKFSAIIGPAMFGIVAQLTGRSQMGASSLSLLFLIGLVCLWLLPAQKGEQR